MRIAPAVLLSALLPTVAAASTSSGMTVNDTCTTSRLTTCASVQVQYVRLGGAGAPVLSIRGSGVSEPTLSSSSVPGIRFSPMFGQGVSGSVNNPQILAIFWNDEGRPVECHPGGPDCPTVGTVTTPEPVTMTLLATGLIGMAGANRLRRRRKLSEV